MTRTDRLTGILLSLRGGQRSVQSLADRFGVSRRTILRDLAALSEIGVPIVTTSGIGGGVGLAEGYWLPPLHVSAGEAATLLLGLQALGSAAAPLAAERRTAEEKLRAILDAELARRVDRELDLVTVSMSTTEVDPHVFNILQSAIRRAGWVSGIYRSEQKEATRVLRPARLLFEDGRWYCLASNTDSTQERRYRLDRFIDLRPSAGPAIHSLSSLSNDEHAAQRPYDDPSYPELVIRLTYVGMRRAEDERGWRDHLTDGGDGTWSVRFHCPPAEHPFYARLVYALGPEAEAVSPPAFRALVVALVDRTRAHYQLPT